MAVVFIFPKALAQFSIHQIVNKSVFSIIFLDQCTKLTMLVFKKKAFGANS